MSRLRTRLVPFLLGAGATAAADRALRAVPPGGAARWTRTNYAGREVTLTGGAAAGVGAVAGALTGALTVTTRRSAAGTSTAGALTAGALTAGAVAATAGAGLGLLDDLGEVRSTTAPAKGLRGHLGALARGEVTTGALKIAGIGTGALLASAVVTPRRTTARPLAVLTGGALIAATANLHNLFDLRPGRSLKVATAVATPLTLAAPAPSAAVAATALGVAAASLPGDLGERSMLGDTGANAVGALVGTALAAHPSARLRGAALAVAVALTLLSEQVSFSRVIDSTPVLRRLDALGRRS